MTEAEHENTLKYQEAVFSHYAGQRPISPAIKPLNEALRDWTDFDGAAFQLGCALGITSGDWFKEKGKFWTDNPTGNMASSMLDTLVKYGVLEQREEPDLQYRWNPTWNGTVTIDPLLVRDESEKYYPD